MTQASTYLTNFSEKVCNPNSYKLNNYSDDPNSEIGDESKYSELFYNPIREIEKPDRHIPFINKRLLKNDDYNEDLESLLSIILEAIEKGKDQYSSLMKGIDSLKKDCYEGIKEELQNVAWVNGINIESILQALKYFYELDKLPSTPTFHYDTDTNLFKFIFSKDKERLELAFSDNGFIYYLYDLYDEYHTHIEGSAYLSDKISHTKRIHKIFSLMENFR